MLKVAVQLSQPTTSEKPVACCLFLPVLLLHMKHLFPTLPLQSLWQR